jgi:hypothetical protein
MSARATNVGPGIYLAECLGCNWASDAANAMGNAARHHDATGHAVRVETRASSPTATPPPGHPARPPSSSRRPRMTALCYRLRIAAPPAPVRPRRP